MTPSNLTPVQYYDNTNDFPAKGKTDVLYYTNHGIYNWRESINEYNLIANANT